MCVCVCVYTHACSQREQKRVPTKGHGREYQEIFISSLFFSEHSNFSTVNFVTIKTHTHTHTHTQILQYLFSFKHNIYKEFLKKGGNVDTKLRGKQDTMLYTSYVKNKNIKAGRG